MIDETAYSTWVLLNEKYNIDLYYGKISNSLELYMPDEDCAEGEFSHRHIDLHFETLETLSRLLKQRLLELETNTASTDEPPIGVYLDDYEEIILWFNKAKDNKVLLEVRGVKYDIDEDIKCYKRVIEIVEELITVWEEDEDDWGSVYLYG